MLNLTKEEAIRRHQILWNWIAQTSIQEQRCVDKIEAFEHFGWSKHYVQSYCWCCGYAQEEFIKYRNSVYCEDHPSQCFFCPVEWPGGHCANGLFLLLDQFIDAFCAGDDYIEVAKIAYKIAELPEKR